jgi:hypothetical protein
MHGSTQQSQCTFLDPRLPRRAHGHDIGVTDKQNPDELTDEELERQNGEELPDREVMSLITPPTGADGIATIAPNEPPAAD